MDLKEIQNLIKFVAKSGASEVKLEMDDVKITIRTGSDNDAPTVQYTPVAAPQVAQAPPAPVAETPAPAAAAAAPKEATDETSKYITIKSPIIGTFYRKPSPDKPLFVEVGQTIAEGDVLCIIEAMKLFNEIESEVSGKIVKILVDDSSPVEFDQPLFLVDPS
ncbi:acetyl-CoA carboxylase biotin carboxyl carrier protein [Jejuia pallidilutea]|uniref:Biotin carboxyl carrier protein of acetyl-CoA carboxylase n=1 Tax=Jejuia pallidilutea TaxID=504487 RepID=A0A090VQ76_9FLAO|nr:acetyl-CoA carboxylase biotin carboxyl carrier protein [Jejuia pallidilutea]PQV49531.1 acetyl-CoA carboxylase biotin carboxyl carrier protein [Jejuia pallidilutea]GAL65464.1 biotin carboxyl carrier protein of acetyl-CoA carboxylase [Jejuia pallidilutea]GAL70021.1 biotin carboxyl carrier protein of acetyl-CoA carboxylase [Jejuia pallidilutea]GAL88982.1 biotin carboxyl carrier protein of acetyl-CoA carboxylase [Jejuia pallidilutea]